MTDPQLTVAREVNLAHRFSVDEEKAREWLGRIVAAYPDEARDVSAEAPTISADWNARSDGAEWTAERLVRGAVEDGILTCPDGMDVNFIYEPDTSDGGSYHFAVDIGHDVATQVSLNTWGFGMRKLGDPDATGIEAALSILDEAESYSNKALADLAPLIAAQSGQGRLAAGLTPADGSEDPRVTAARALVNGPLPRSDRQLPSHVLTSWYHELNRAARGLLEVIDGHPAGTEASTAYRPSAPDSDLNRSRAVADASRHQEGTGKPNVATPNHPLAGTEQQYLPAGKVPSPDANTTPSDHKTVARLGDTVTVLDVYENWNGVSGLTVAYVYVHATGYHTHLSAGEMGITGSCEPGALPARQRAATSPTSTNETTEQAKAPAGRTPAPQLAGSSFPTPAQTGSSAAPPGPDPRRARQNPPDQAEGRRRSR